jgi:hypothetical protein
MSTFKNQTKFMILLEITMIKHHINESSFPITLFFISSATRFTLFTTCLEVISKPKPLFSYVEGNWLQFSLDSLGFWFMNSL